MRTIGGVLATLVSLLLAGGVAAQAPADSVEFVMTRGADTLSVERVVRTPARLESEMHVGRTNVRWDADVAPDARLPRIRAAFGPEVLAEVEFRGDSAFAAVSGASTPPLQRFAPGEGALPYINLSVGVLEQVVRRAAAVGGDRVEIPMLDLGGGRIFSASVVREGGEGVRITLPPGVEIRLRTDRDGRVLGGEIQAQGIRIERAG